MPQYRIEVSPNNRAGCKDTVCKASATKITKGELRFGTWVEINEHGSWGWKHWGCVSGAQLLNIKETCDQGDDKFDFDLIDGYDELGDHPEIQEKIRRCVKQAHIDDEDFKGDLEKNKPGVKGIHLTAKQKADKEKAAAGVSYIPTLLTQLLLPPENLNLHSNAFQDDSEEEVPKKKGAKRGRKKAEVEDDEDDEPVAKKTKTSKAAKAAPKTARGKAAAKKAAEKEETDSALTESVEEDASEPEVAPKKASKPKAKAAAPAKAKAPAKARGKADDSAKDSGKKGRRTFKAAVKVSSDEEEAFEAADVADSDDEPLPAAKNKASAKAKAADGEKAKARRGRPRKA